MALVNEVALDSIPSWMETGSTFHAVHFRRLSKILAGAGSGNVGSGDFAVTAQGTPNMTVAVAAGEAVVVGTQDVTHQGAYVAESFASKNVTIPAAHATLGRIDRVCIGVYDQEYAGARYAGVLGIVQGTPSGSPVAPTMPTDGTFYELAQVTVDAAVTSIVSGKIADKRVRLGFAANFLQALGAASPVTSSSRFLGRGSVTGSPATGTWAVGDYMLDSVGVLWFCTAAGTPGTWVTHAVKLFETTLGAPATTIRLPTSGALPGGYRSLVIDYMLRSTHAATNNDDFYVQLNDDATVGNYDSERSFGSGTSAISSNESIGGGAMVVGYIQAANAPASTFSRGRIEIPFCGIAAGDKSVNAKGSWKIANASAGQLWYAGMGSWRTTGTAVTSATLSLSASQQFATGSYVAVYGMP